MSMPLLVEVAEKAFGAAAELRTRPSTESSLATLTRDFDAGVRDFSRRLLDPELATSRATIVLALETLGRGLEAFAVDFFAAESIGDPDDGARGDLEPVRGFLRVDRWIARPARGPCSLAILPDPFDLESWPAVRESLAAGRVHCLAAGTAMQGGTVPAEASGWKPHRAVLFVPCPSPQGLIGFFCVDVGAGIQAGCAPLLERAQHLGLATGLALDRLRLEAALARERESSDHRMRLELIGRVTSATAHDLNNILTASLGYGELLKLELDLKPGDPGHEDFTELQTANQRAAKVVGELLRFGRRQTDGVETLDLGEAITSLSGMLRQVLGRAVELDVRPAEDPTPVRLDRSGFESVLLNLTANARAAVGESGHFTLASAVVSIDGAGRDEGADPVPIPGLVRGDYVRLTARDDGCGIPTDVLPRVFEPFFTTKAPGKGTGLGLPSIVEFVKTANGGVRVDSVEGEGTCFHLYFPLAADPATP